MSTPPGTTSNSGSSIEKKSRKTTSIANTSPLQHQIPAGIQFFPEYGEPTTGIVTGVVPWLSVSEAVAEGSRRVSAPSPPPQPVGAGKARRRRKKKDLPLPPSPQNRSRPADASSGMEENSLEAAEATIGSTAAVPASPTTSSGGNKSNNTTSNIGLSFFSPNNDNKDEKNNTRSSSPPPSALVAEGATTTHHQDHHQEEQHQENNDKNEYGYDEENDSTTTPPPPQRRIDSSYYNDGASSRLMSNPAIVSPSAMSPEEDNYDYYNISSNNVVEDDTSSPCLVEATLVGDNDDQEEQQAAETTPMMMVTTTTVAQKAGIKDYLSDKRLQCFLVGLIILVVAIVLVVQLFIVSHVNNNNKGGDDAPSPTSTSSSTPSPIMFVSEGNNNIFDRPTTTTTTTTTTTDGDEDQGLLLDERQILINAIDAFIINSNSNNDSTTTRSQTPETSQSIIPEYYSSPIIGEWDVSRVDNFNYLFKNPPRHTFNENINNWTTSQVTSMKGTFYGTTTFNQPLDRWDTARVTTMYDMFATSTSFNQSLNKWNVSRVKDLSYLFQGSKSFNKPLDKWDTSNVQDFRGAFKHSIFNQDISTWNISNASNLGIMFQSNPSFNQNLCGWNKFGFLPTARFSKAFAESGCPNTKAPILLSDNNIYSPICYDCTTATETATSTNAPNNNINNNNNGSPAPTMEEIPTNEDTQSPTIITQSTAGNPEPEGLGTRPSTPPTEPISNTITPSPTQFSTTITTQEEVQPSVSEPTPDVVETQSPTIHYSPTPTQEVLPEEGQPSPEPIPYPPDTQSPTQASSSTQEEIKEPELSTEPTPDPTTQTLSPTTQATTTTIQDAPTIAPTTTATPPPPTTCSTGIPRNEVCCAASCGECGGSGCGGREGGAAACCDSPIQESGLSCLNNPPPCVIDLPVNPGDPVNPFCASSTYLDGTSASVNGGIRDDNTGACCLESCGSCGDDTTPDSDGNTCENRSGGAAGCCVSDIIANAPTSSNSCEFHEPPCYSNLQNGITFENWKANDNSHPWHPLNQVVKSATKCESANNQCLETTFEPNDRGTERVTGLTPLPQALEYTLTYDIKFDDNFEFVKGGKLHGLGPANHVSGCSPMTDTGWSARVMWREEGEVIIYVYHQDKTHNCGHNFRSDAYFTRGQWETISLYVKVNSAYDKFDGKVQLYLNGQLIAEALDLRFVDDPEWAAPYHSEGYIANFMFSAFHGGSNTDWSPTTTQKAWIDNISVVPGHAVPTSAATTTANATNTTITNITNNDDNPATAIIRKRSSVSSATDKAKAATVVPEPKTYDAHELSCEDQDAIPFDDDTSNDINA